MLLFFMIVMMLPLLRVVLMMTMIMRLILAVIRMSKQDDKVDDEMASAIIVSTCQLLPKSSSAVSDHMNNLVASTEPNPKVYSILCGSFAECYIRPLIPCISDVDFLKCHADTLAFTGELPVLPIDIRGLSDRIVF